MIILQATPCIALIENYNFTESIIMISSQCIIIMYYRTFVYKNSFPTVITRQWTYQFDRETNGKTRNNNSAIAVIYTPNMHSF